MKFVLDKPRRKNEMRPSYILYDDGTVYLEAEDREGWWSDLTVYVNDPEGIISEEGAWVVLNHDLVVPRFTDIINSLISYIADSSKEVLIGPWGAKSLALKLKDNWKEQCVPLEV